MKKFILFAMFCLIANCMKAVVASGTCGADGNNIKWTLSDAYVLTLTGSGKMNEYANAVNYSFNPEPWGDYADKILDVEIGSGITNIGDLAFYDCTNLKILSIPNSITSIGVYAFRSCKSLTSMDIPSYVTSIGIGAFMYCTSMASITIPNSVTSIGMCAFQNCSALESVTIPSSITTLETGLFQICSSLTSVTIPKSVTSIEYGAFGHCTALKSITIPNSVTSLGSLVFQYCQSLTSLNIPSSVTSIESELIVGCTSLTSVTVDSNNKVYDSRNDCNAIIKTATNELLSGCCTTKIPNSVTSIGNKAFTDITSLTSIAIPNSVTSIGYYAFLGCTGLSTISIPSTVSSIGSYALSTIPTVYCYSKTPPTLNYNWTSIEGIVATLYVPAGCVDVYTAANYYKYQFKEIVEMPDPCATPTIVVKSGKYCFECETSGAEIHWNCSLQSKELSGTGNCIESVPSTLMISAYATADGHSPSETATATIDLSNVGDVNRDGKVDISDISALVSIVLGK